MEKKSVGNYFLVFEPKYASYQFAVYFSSNGEVITSKIDKYTDIVHGDNKKIKKNTLGDIDKVLTVLSNEKDFFDKYIDSSVFRYTGNNLHKIFIGKMSKVDDRRYMKCYECVFNSDELNDKLKFVSGSKIDKSYYTPKENEEVTLGKGKLISLLTDPDSDFLQFVLNTKQLKKEKYFSTISSSTLEIATDLRRCNRDINEGRMSGTYDEADRLKDRLYEKLTSYKEFRELFLIKQQYLIYLENQKEELIELKDKIPNNNPIEPKHPMYEQISIFPEENEKVKKLGNNKN